MNLAKEAKEIIRTLEDNRFYVECPCCEETILLKEAGLFYLDDFSPQAEDLYKQRMAEIKEGEKELRERRKSIPRISETKTTAVNIGFILERIAPSMKEFRFDRNDCRSLFEPIDRNVSRKPRLVGGVKGHNINENTLPGSPALWAGSFTM